MNKLKTTQKVWILTSEYNDYDQHGGYFLAVFANKPLPEQLTASGIPKYWHDHVLSGGGRKSSEYEWWNLKEEELK